MPQFLASRGPVAVYWTLLSNAEAICWECMAEDSSDRVYYPARRVRRCTQCGYQHHAVSVERALA